MSAFDSTPDSITQLALSQNLSLEEKSRKELVLKNKDFYYSKHEGHLSVVNEDQEAISINITHAIVQKRASLLYRAPLVREFIGPANSISFLEDLYKQIHIDSILLQADLLSELTGSALVMVDTSEDKQIKLRVFDASDVSVVPEDNDTSKPAAISLVRILDRLAKNSSVTNPQVERVLRSQVWQADSVVTYDGSVLLTSETNDLGFLPFVNFQGEEVHSQYLGHAPAHSIVKLNQVIDQLLTDLGFMIKMQAATPIALEGFQSGESISIHPGRAISLPIGAKATVLGLSPKIQETLESIAYLEEKLFETSSVPKVSVVGGEGESGRELLVRWFPLLQVFQEKTVRFTRYETNLANMILAVAGLEPLETMNINYPEESALPLSSEQEQLAEDISLNIKTPIDEIMRRNATLDEIEAEAIYLANKETNSNLSLDDEEIDVEEEE